MPSNCVAGEDLRVPWQARSNQSILKEINPKYSLEGLILKLKLQYFHHLMRRADPLEKTLMLGKIQGRRRRGWDGWMASLTQRTWVWANSRRWSRTGKPDVLLSMVSQRAGHNWVTEQQQRFFRQKKQDRDEIYTKKKVREIVKIKYKRIFLIFNQFKS